jgi:hypothetical protein
MNDSKKGWISGLLFLLILVAAPIWYFTGAEATTEHRDIDRPWDSMPRRPAHVDHKDLFEGTFETGQEVTRACLSCHEKAGEQVIHTAHWRWQSDPVKVEGRDQPVSTGKKNTINNFCIGIQGNWASCTACHAGYGWEDQDFDFENTANVDCLACHDNSGGYKKGKKGLPLEGTDLLAAAQPRATTAVAAIFAAAAVTPLSMATSMKASTTPVPTSMFTWGGMISSVSIATRPVTM